MALTIGFGITVGVVVGVIARIVWGMAAMRREARLTGGYGRRAA